MKARELIGVLVIICLLFNCNTMYIKCPQYPNYRKAWINVYSPVYHDQYSIHFKLSFTWVKLRQGIFKENCTISVITSICCCNLSDWWLLLTFAIEAVCQIMINKVIIHVRRVMLLTVMSSTMKWQMLSDVGWKYGR